MIRLMDETPGNGSMQTPSRSPSSKEGEAFWKRYWKLGAGALVAAAVIIVLILAVGSVERGAQRGVAEETYTLVRDKISKSAAIALAVPKGVSMTPVQVEQKVTFEPKLDGKWTAGSKPEQIFFEPSDKLVEGNYYTVSLQTADGILSKDFLVDEDPQILAIFPREKTEAPERSEITIVFNRPMVPLTTLDILEDKDIPIDITPATKGKWKWISTRNLQFIPETHLVRSANYTVTIKEGLTSVDGLTVKGQTHTFTTRPLRYEDNWNGDQVLYNQPFTIRFNQPVDLERTKAELHVTTGGRVVPIIVEYGTRTLYEDGETKDYLDKSVLTIYGMTDRNGRRRFWDFNTSYALVIAAAFSAEGDIALQESRTHYFNVPEVIAEITAESERSRNVSPDIFDPQGKLWVRFYEEIDKNATSIDAPYLKDVQYGERCKRDELGNEIYSGSSCEKEQDKTKISLTFKPEHFGNGQQIPVTFKKIVNIAGLSLIPEPTTRTATT